MCEIISNAKHTAAYLLLREESIPNVSEGIGVVFKLSEDKEKPEPVEFIKDDLAHPFYYAKVDCIDAASSNFIFKIDRPMLYAKMFVISKR